MATNASSESSKKYTSFTYALTRTIDQQTSQHQPTIDQSLLDIAVNAGSDVSSLADKSRGTIDFFHTPPVSSKVDQLFEEIDFLRSLRHHQPNELITRIGRQ